MKKDIKNKWIEALRSGDYKQGKYQLYIPTQNSYCCLGVLCKVANIEIEGNGLTCKGTEDRAYSPIKDLFGEYEKHQMRHFWTMNDAEGKTFTEIAEWIEQNISTED